MTSIRRQADPPPSDVFCCIDDGRCDGIEDDASSPMSISSEALTEDSLSTATTTPLTDGQILPKAKPCRHVSCISLGKLTSKLGKWTLPPPSDSEQPERWLCLCCLQVFPAEGKQMPHHGRTNNHPIFLKIAASLPQAPFSFYCTACVGPIMLNLLQPKSLAIVEKAAMMVEERRLEEDPGATDAVEKVNPGEHHQSPNGSLTLPVGLVNLGNTCFMNSGLQALAAVIDPGMLDSPQSIPGSAPVTHALFGLIGALQAGGRGASLVANDAGLGGSRKKKSPSVVASARRKGNHGSAIDPSAFLGQLSKRYGEFRRMRQQDAHDFLRLLFNTLDDEKGSPLHRRLFGGRLMSRVTCTPEEFLDLSLALKGQRKPTKWSREYRLERNFSQMSLDQCTDDKDEDEDDYESSSVSSDSTTTTTEGELRLADLLNFWVLPTRLEGENAFACENCPKVLGEEGQGQRRFIYQPAIQQFAIEAIPPILVFHLQRFILREEGSRPGKHRSSSAPRLAKDNRHIVAPLILDMGPYVNRARRPSDGPGTNTTKKSGIFGNLVRRRSSVSTAPSASLHETTANASSAPPVECLPGSSFRYELLAMVVHEGWSTEAGHYVAIVRNSQGRWILVSDESVRMIDPRQVPRYNPYLLFYRRIEVV